VADRIRIRVAAEDGFTLFELLIAMAVTAVGLMALVSSFDHSRELVSGAEKTEIATHRAERQMERVLSMSYSQVAHPAAPADSADPDNPASFINGSNYQWDQGSTGPQSSALVVDAGGAITTPQTWTDSESRLQGQVHTFVTQTGDLCPGTVANCPTGTQSGRRVTVAVTVEGPSPLEKPVLISSLMINPAATGGS
jgi:prepilin-type N-terminal cleavage/methylation domain-containing protein